MWSTTACIAACGADPAIQIIPVASDQGQVIATLETRLFKPRGDGPFPVAILSHGASGGAPKTSITWERAARYWNSKGYVAIAPMRRGRGKSTGESLESEGKNCDLQSWRAGIASAMQDLDATIEFARRLSFAKADQVLLAGVSRGGFLSVAYAAQGKYKAQVSQVVSVSGGWVAQAKDRCPVDFNLVKFSEFGGEVRAPMLWLYGANDSYFTYDDIVGYAAAFNSAGGIATLHLIGNIPTDGHALSEHPTVWIPYVDQFVINRASRDR